MASCSNQSSVVSPSDIYLDNSHVPAREQLTMRERPPRRGPDLVVDEWDSELPNEGVISSLQKKLFAQKLDSAIRVLKSEAFNLESQSLPSVSVDNGAVLQVLSELKISELPIPKEDVRRMVEIVRKHLKAFAVSPTDVGRTHLATHRIDVGTNPPFKERTRPVPHAWREFLDQELDKLLSIGVIEEADPSDCPYASRCVVVRKRDGTFRLCVDYRRLNAITVKDSYPFPRIDEILASLGKARYFA